MHTHSPDKPKKFKEMFACRKAHGSCFLWQESSVDGEIHVTRGHNNVKKYITKQQKAWNAGIWCSVPPWLHICIQLLTLEHCWSILTWSCLTTLLTALISLWATAICLPTWRSGWDHSASAIMKSWWKMSKHGWAHRWQTYLTHTSPIISSIYGLNLERRILKKILKLIAVISHDNY
jgi:hypothetical protein